MVSKSVWEAFAFVLITAVLTAYPFTWALLMHLDFGQEITSPYLNGLITASGVFVGFLCASVISRAKDLTRLSFLLASYALLIFFVAVTSLSFNLASKSRATLVDLLIVESSLIVSGVTAWNVMHTLFRKSTPS